MLLIRNSNDTAANYGLVLLLDHLDQLLSDRIDSDSLIVP